MTKQHDINWLLIKHPVANYINTVVACLIVHEIEFNYSYHFYSVSNKHLFISNRQVISNLLRFFGKSFLAFAASDEKNKSISSSSRISRTKILRLPQVEIEKKLGYCVFQLH